MSLSNKIADFVSGKFEQKAEDGRTFCALVILGEPDFSQEILLEEEI